MLISPTVHEMLAKARHDEFMAEAARDRLVQSARPPRAPLPNPAALIRTLLTRMRPQSGGSRTALPADGSWATTPEVGT